MGDLSKHFSRSEFACHCGCGGSTVDYELLVVLEELRERLKHPIIVVSGYRCSAHNVVVGGARDSQHMQGRAADIKSRIDPAIIYDQLDELYKGKYGMGKYSTFTHIDTRSKCARW